MLFNPNKSKSRVGNKVNIACFIFSETRENSTARRRISAERRTSLQRELVSVVDIRWYFETMFRWLWISHSLSRYEKYCFCCKNLHCIRLCFDVDYIVDCWGEIVTAQRHLLNCTVTYLSLHWTRYTPFRILEPLVCYFIFDTSYSPSI